jgi:hypothetical protein
MSNRRVYYACEAFGIAAESTTTFVGMRGVQSVGVTTSYNIDTCFELGMLAIYNNVEQLPDVEVTASKVLDGHPLLYHAMTQGATSADLAGRSTKKFNAALNVYVDTAQSASGTPIAQSYMSGMFVSQVQYAMPVEGKFTESVTGVGNNKKLLRSGFTFTPTYTQTGIPLASEGVNYRQHMDMTTSRFPKEIPGVTTSGTYTQSGGLTQTVFQGITVSCNLGREGLFELGRRGPFFRYVNFPVEVTSEITVLMTESDGVEADENATSNTTDQVLYFVTTEGTKLDLGSKNRLQSVQTSNIEAGGGGNNNATLTYKYRNFNVLSVVHPQDPTVALRG